jgi:hypothetical protein
MSMIDSDATLEFEGGEAEITPEAQAPEAGQAEAEGSTEREYAPVDDFRDKYVKVKVDGAEDDVTVDELIKGYQRQSDYTRKTQELAQQRQELEAARTLQAALENNPEATLQFLQQHYGVSLAQAQQMAQDAVDTVAAEDPYADLPPQLRSEIQRLRVAADYVEQQRADAELHSTLNSLQASYGDFDSQELVRYAVSNGATHPSELPRFYKMWAFDRQHAGSQAQAEFAATQAASEAQREAAKAAAANTVTTGAGASEGSIGSSTTDRRFRSVAEAWEAAKEQARRDGITLDF